MSESSVEESLENIREEKHTRQLPWQLGILRKVPAVYIAIIGSLIMATAIYILCLVFGDENISGIGYFLVLFMFFTVLTMGYMYKFISTHPVRLILYGIGIIGLLVCNYFVIHQISKTEEPDYTIAKVLFILSFSIPLLALINLSAQKRVCRVIEIIKSVIFGTVVVFGAFFIIEECSGTDILSINADYWDYNLLILALIAGLMYLFIFRIRISLSILLVFALVVGLANGYVIVFRGSPILPADLYLMKTAMEVSGGYNYMPTTEMWIGISFFIMAIMLAWAIKEPKLSRKWRLIGRGIFAAPYVAAVIIVGICFNSEVNDNLYMLNLWQPVNTYKRYGSTYGFGMNFIAMQVQKPEGYSQDKVDSILKDYTSDETVTEEKPNIIVILCEAFSDPAVLGDFKTNTDYLPNYRSLSENVIKGYAYSSVLGGTTADSEYEFLTGNAITYLPAGTVPYQQYINKKTLNFTWTMKDLGYSATALHPYSRNTYRREIVYPLLGFDEYLDISFVNPPEYLRYYMKDSADFKKIINLYENRDTTKPFYLYNVTMQNHSPYDLGRMVNNINVLDGDYPQADEYLSCISATDAAIPILIDYFNQVKEPTYILFVGDHQPNLYDGFFEYLLGAEQSDLTIEQLQKRYQVPFFIWSNQDIEEKQVDAISLNYLSSYFFKEIGMPLTAYNKYLLNLYEKYPVVNINGYLDEDKVWHNTVELKQNEDLKDYNILVYNSVVNNNQDIERAYQLK